MEIFVVSTSMSCLGIKLKFMNKIGKTRQTLMMFWVFWLSNMDRMTTILLLYLKILKKERKLKIKKTGRGEKNRHRCQTVNYNFVLGFEVSDWIELFLELCAEDWLLNDTKQSKISPSAEITKSETCGCGHFRNGFIILNCDR